MKLDTFIKRPVLSTVISIFIVVLGLLGIVSLPIMQYPDIAPPTISVSTSYTGADAQTVLNSVVAPIEEEINGVEDMLYMTSSATNNGTANISVTFKQGTDPDMAAVKVQNRVSKALGFLPSEVTRVGVLTQKRQTSMLMVFSIYDDEGRYSTEFVENYADINIIPQVKRVKGVGEAMMLGASYSMRIWLKPDVMAQYHLMPSDITAVLAEQNIEAAPGAIGENSNKSFQYTLRYKGRLEKPEEFENIVISADQDGNILRLKDVADVELGRLTYAVKAKTDGKNGVSCVVFQSAGSNATETVQELQKLLKETEQTLPPGMKIRIQQNVNDFLFASIHEVIKTLIEAFILVFIVVYLFLQDFRSTLIPSIAIPVALIGTFFALYVIGFSINLLTLCAMVLAIAIVVDDAIVVVEGVHAKLDLGYKSTTKASIDAMNELGGAIVSITLVMMAVFIPVSFMPGTSGTFYQQFGLTMAIAIGFSALNALTLSPALCALFLKAHNEDGEELTTKEKMNIAMGEARDQMKKKYTGGFYKLMHPAITIICLIATIIGMIIGAFSFENILMLVIFSVIALIALIGIFTKRFHDAFNNFYNKLLEKYKKHVRKLVERPLISIVAVVISFFLLGYLMNVTPTGLVPNEDVGTIMGVVSMPAGTTLERTEEVLNKVDAILSENHAIESRTMIIGYSFMSGQGPSYGSFICKLRNWEERRGSLEQTIKERSDVLSGLLYLQCREEFKDAQIFFFAPPMIPGYSVTNGFTFNLQDKTGGSLDKFYEVAQNFLAKLNERPEISSAQTSFSPNYPQYMVDVDVAACKKAGISPSTILTTLQGYYGGMYVSNFNRFGKLYRVMLQADPQKRGDLESLNSIKVRNGAEMAPITQFMSMHKVYGPDIINRFNLYTSMSVDGSPATGYTSGQAIEAIKETAAQHLPVGYSFEFSGMTREEESSSGSTTILIFILCFAFVYLLLSAQYESYVVPFAVLLSVPFGLAGSFLFAHLMGGLNSIIPIFSSASNNIYMQIALIMLIGLLAKNAILIVEFALERRRMGMGLTWAAILGAAARLRPILMTSLAMIVGLLPMMFAMGAGANGNRALGSATIGGMLLGMIFQIFVVPSLFVIFQYLQEKIKPIKFDDIDNQDINKEIEQYAK